MNPIPNPILNLKQIQHCGIMQIISNAAGIESGWKKFFRMSTNIDVANDSL